MGKHLQIIVTSKTWVPEDVEKAWRRLDYLAWGHVQQGGPQPQKGVLELVTALDDALLFGAHAKSKDLKATLEPKLAVAKDRKRKLESALADWLPKEANQLSNEIEDLLDELERLAPPVPK